MLRILNSVADNERSETPENLCKIGADIGVIATAFADLQTAISKAKKTGKMIVVCGSLYLYQDLYKIIEKNGKK